MNEDNVILFVSRTERRNWAMTSSACVKVEHQINFNQNEDKREQQQQQKKTE